MAAAEVSDVRTVSGMTMEFVPGVTRLSWIPEGGEPVDMSGSVTKIEMHYVDPEAPFPYGFDMKPIIVRLKWLGTPALYRLLVGRTHPRIRRMHSAYGRKRGRGRW